jgi:ABC-type transport system involved in Fe-S cluster assembly fused permease/ATPase subunit
MLSGFFFILAFCFFLWPFVDFGYNEEKIVLHNISLYAEPGQKVAFVGSTGAGKTTITTFPGPGIS